MRKIFFVVLFVFCSCLFSSEMDFSFFNLPLQKELLEMQAEDQSLRMRADFSKESLEKISQIDIEHCKRLKEIIETYGWPGVSIVGEEGAFAMWLLVQHQDRDCPFQKECLNLLKGAVDLDEVPFSCYAYLLDRVRMNENLRQSYGTQWIKEDGKFVLYDVEDIENLDERRSQAGLSSIEDYKKELKEMFHLNDEDFK